MTIALILLTFIFHMRETAHIMLQNHRSSEHQADSFHSNYHAIPHTEIQCKVTVDAN